MKPLTTLEQKCYDLFMEGLTAHQICQRLKIRSDFVTDARYRILEKGYELPKLEVPTSELPRNMDEIVSLKRKPKEDERMRNPKKVLTDEERQQIIDEVGAGMSQKECAEKHRVYQSYVSRIISKHRKELAEQANPEHVPQIVPQHVPRIVIELAERRLDELDAEIESARDDLEILTQERDGLIAWLGGAYDEG